MDERADKEVGEAEVCEVLSPIEYEIEESKVGKSDDDDVVHSSPLHHLTSESEFGLRWHGGVTWRFLPDGTLEERKQRSPLVDDRENAICSRSNFLLRSNHC